MSHRLLLAAALLVCCAGESLVHGEPQKVGASVGEAAVLPCSFEGTADSNPPDVEWSKKDLKPEKVVLLYQNGCERFGMKNPAFHFRTSLFTTEVKNRNVSLRISHVQLSDAGEYVCSRLSEKGPLVISTVELIVGVVSEPEISVVSVDDEGVTLECKAGCLPTEPDVTFLDEGGNNITAAESKRRQNDSGCYSVTHRVKLWDSARRVVCRVHQPEIDQTREAKISVPGGCKCSCSLIIGIAVAAAVLITASLCGLVVCVFKTCEKSAKSGKLPVTRQSSDQTTVSLVNRSVEDLPLLHSDATDGAGGIIEELKKENNELKAKLQEMKESNNRPQSSPVILYIDKPTLCSSPTASPCSNLPNLGDLPQDQGPKPDSVGQGQGPKPVNVAPSQGPTRGNVAQSQGPTPANVAQGQGPTPANVAQNQGPTPANVARSQGPKPVNRAESQGRKHNFFQRYSTSAPEPPFHSSHTQSSPDFSTSVDGASSSLSEKPPKKKLGQIGRSMSDCAPRDPKPQRRLSFIICSNRFSALSNFNEDSEHLVPKT